MPTTLVSDDFNRANSATSLGVATSGQTWNQVSGVSGSFGINGNEALWTWNAFDPTGRVLVESGAANGIAQVALVDPTSGSGSFGIGVGLIFRYVDASNYWRLVYYKFPGPANQLRLERIYAGGTTTPVDVSVTLSDGDVIGVGYCGSNLEIFVNSVSQGTYDDSGNPQNYGTLCGLTGSAGSFFATITKRFDNFLVTTDDACPLAAWPIPALQWAASGSFTPPIPVGSTPTKRFDAGTGPVAWYLVASLSDSGDELRDKCVKDVHVVGKITDANFQVYAYGPADEINVTDIEDGVNSSSGVRALPNTAKVARSARVPSNIPNAMEWTIRVAGTWNGGAKDRVDQIGVEVSQQGVRR